MNKPKTDLETTWAWTFFDSKERSALKKQAAAAKEAAPA